MSKKTRRLTRAVIQVVSDSVSYEIECVENSKKFCLKRLAVIVQDMHPISPNKQIICLDVGKIWNSDGMQEITPTSWKTTLASDIERLNDNIRKHTRILESGEEEKQSNVKASIRWAMEQKKFKQALLYHYNDLHE